MTEDVKIRVTADADQLVNELRQATAALKGMAATAQRSSSSTASSLKSIEFQTMARNVAEAAKKVFEFGRASYEMATAWRDAAKQLNTAGLSNLTGDVDAAEESLRRIKDSFGALSATMLQEFAPALEMLAGKVRDFTVGSAFVIERVSLALTYLTQGEEAAFQQWTEHQGQLEALSKSLLRSTDGQIEAQERATKALREQEAALKATASAEAALLSIMDTATADTLSGEQALLRGLGASLRSIREIEAEALNTAGVNTVDVLEASAAARLEVERRYERDLGDLRQEAARRQGEIDAVTTQKQINAAAALASQREQSDQIVVSSATQTASVLAGLLKDGSKEAAAAQKAAALFAVTVNTIQGASKAIAELGPFGIPAAAAIGALGAAQAAAIASAPMPSFDRGGVVDGGPQYPGGRPGQRLAQVEDGEMVLTRKMQEAMGQQGPQTVILRVGSREFGRAVIDSGATDGLQRRRGVGQRRYGG